MSERDSLPNRGDRTLTGDEAGELSKQLEQIKECGFTPKYMVVSKNHSTKIMCELTQAAGDAKTIGKDLSSGRIALQEKGFDITGHRSGGQAGRIEWQITKRTTPGTGWA